MSEKTKLIGSAPTLEQVLKGIGDYYFSPNITLHQCSPDIWEVSNSKGIINSVRVRRVKGRYRFERIITDNSSL